MGERTDFLRGVEIELDRARPLRFGYLALEALESASGVALSDLMNPENPLFRSARGARILLWACLLDDDPMLKCEDVGRLIDRAPGENLLGRLDYVMARVGECLRASFDVDADTSAAKKNGSGLSPGETSKPSPVPVASPSESSTG